MSTLHVVADAKEKQKNVMKVVVDGRTTASSSQNIHAPQQSG